MKFVARDTLKLNNPIRSLNTRRVIKHKTRSSGVSFEKGNPIGDSYVKPGKIYTYLRPNGQSKYIQPL